MLAVFPEVRAVGVNDRRGVVVDTGLLLLIDREINTWLVSRASSTFSVNRRTVRHPLGIRVILRVLDLAYTGRKTVRRRSKDAQYYAYAERVPDGPTVTLMSELARETNQVLILRSMRRKQTGVYYNTAAVIDADGSYLGNTASITSRR